jgi:hypothetical protein
LKAMSRIGLRLGWRNHDAICRLVEMICRLIEMICRLIEMAGSQHDRAALDREPLSLPRVR